MTKRITAILLCVLLIIGAIFSTSGCQNTTSNNSITKGEVLYMVLDSFGMLNYGSSEQTASDCIQIASDWSMIDANNTNAEDAANKGFLAEVLVKCVGLKDTSDMSSDDILEYAANNNYVSFEYRGRTDSIRNVTMDEVTESIKRSFDIWTNRTLEKKEDIVLGENVVDLSKEDPANKIEIDHSSNEITLPSAMGEKIKPGETFIVPPENAFETAKAYKAEKVESIGDKSIIKISDADIETAIQDMKVSGNVEPDLTDAYIIDGVGNIVGDAPEASLQSSLLTDELSDMKLISVDDTEPQLMGKDKKKSIKFSIDGLEVQGEVSKKSIGFSVKGDILTNNKDNVKLTISKGYEIKDIGLDYDYDIEWFSLKSAYAKVNYTTVDKSGISVSYKKGLVKAPEYTNGNGKFLSNWKRSHLKDSQAKGAKTIKICSVAIVNGGVVSFNLDVKIKISISGSVELIVTTNNVKGIEYKKGKVRYIKEQHEDTDLKARCKAELTLYAGFSFRALGFNILGLGIEGGIGCEASATLHLADSENRLIDEIGLGNANTDIVMDSLSGLNGASYSHDEYGEIRLRCDLCIDVTTYFILKFCIDSDCLISKFVKSSFEIVFFDKDNAKIDLLSGHWEDGKKVPECTRKYSSATDEQSDGDQSGKQSDTGSGQDEGKGIISEADSIDIDTYFVNLNIGENYQILTEELPYGYQNSDVEYVSADQNIASVGQDGMITGVSEGFTEIRVQTKDKKYSVSCSVYIIGEPVAFTPLDNSISA